MTKYHIGQKEVELERLKYIYRVLDSKTNQSMVYGTRAECLIYIDNLKKMEERK